MLASLCPPTHRSRVRSWLPRAWAVMLGVLVVATMLMPVSYRAGAAESHPHTILQGVIDRFVGQPHHHGDAEPALHAPRLAPSPFAPLWVPLSLLATTSGIDVNHSPSVPDLPELLGLAMPISALAAIQVLALLVTALLAGYASRPLWTTSQSIHGWAPAIECPPPRVA